MNNMKCPFCQQELVRHWGMEEPALYCCDNPKCSRGGVATESAWQELIRTRKALDVAKEGLKSAHDYYEYCIQRDKDCDSDDINWDCTALNMDNDISEALEQIIALEQKDK